MVGELIRMRLALARNAAAAGGGAVWKWCGVVVGGALAVGVVVLAALPLQPASLVPDLLGVAYLSWLIGWLVGPVLSPAPLLRPSYLAMLPLQRRRLAAGLLVAGFFGLSSAVTGVLFTSLVVYAVRLGVFPALLSLPLAALQMCLLVLMSRVAYVVFGRLARARSGAALNGLLLAVVLVLTQSGWMLFVGLAASGLLEQGFPAGISAALRWAPSGWALAAVESAGAGNWAQTVAAVTGMLVLGAVLLILWSTTLGEARGARALVRGSAGRRTPRSMILPAAAVLQKELRSWVRDPSRLAAVTTPLAWGLLTAVLPLTYGSADLLPWAGTLIAVMGASMCANLYGFDGTGVWLALQSGTERADVRGRQWAYLALFGPVSLLATVAGTAWSGLDWAWPWALAGVAGAVGGGAGLIAWTSVAAPVPGPDATDRAENPVEGTEGVGPAFAVFFAAFVPPLPGLAVVLAGTLTGSAALQWAGVLAGASTGVLLAWGLGRLAAARLVRTGPELLQLMRTRHAAPAKTAGPTQEPELTGRESTLVLLGWIAGPLAGIAQGLVPAVLKLTGNTDVRVWFLAMYLPEPWGWLTSIGMMLLGAALTRMALQVRRRAAGNAVPEAAPAVQGSG
ncbi:hypothetical protein [Arthrobacter caoxuetaonis]|uniref:hypothetical protein n=1 Tax=Arthrobacter caoxuetaonis TaxID=2886935 RepID=UPI001D154D48|nr:hypothetical protein [Arthrobacter caoxuetaonis]MCC3282922.1 hypothetical protein [Arthrobacter caoxuetaonis]